MVLGETTEVYGGEHLLTRRAKNAQVAQDLIDRIHWWENYTALFGASIDNNPAPGNKLGGLTTIFEKSLGAHRQSRKHATQPGCRVWGACYRARLRPYGHTGL